MAEAAPRENQPDALPLRVEVLFYRETDRDYVIGPHYHRIHQWYVLLHGGVDMTINDRTFALHPNQSIIIPPGAVRSPRARARAPGYLVAVFECFGLDLSEVTNEVLETPLELHAELMGLVDELRLPKGAESRHLAAALLTRLLIGLKRAKLAHQPPSPSTLTRHLPELIIQAEVFMERNFYRTLTRGDVASAVHLSEPHLGRVFRSATGKTVLQRLTEIRMAHAGVLLLESDLAITQIALDVGISSFSHFTYTFKKATGLTPSDYRRVRGRHYL